MVKRLKELSLVTLGDIYDSDTDGLAAFVLAEDDLKPLTEQIDFRTVRKTHCKLRIGQVWGEVLEDGSYLLIEYLGRGKEGGHCSRWTTLRNRQGVGARLGDTVVMESADFAHGAGKRRDYRWRRSLAGFFSGGLGCTTMGSDRSLYRTKGGGA